MAIYSLTFNNAITKELLSEGDKLLIRIDTESNVSQAGSQLYLEGGFRDFGTIINPPLPFPPAAPNQLYFDANALGQENINEIIVGDMVLAAKGNGVESSGIKGYFATARFTNNSKKRAELFAIGAQIQPSSK